MRSLKNGQSSAREMSQGSKTSINQQPKAKIKGWAVEMAKDEFNMFKIVSSDIKY